jgi:serine/threonine protein kinase
MSEETLPSSNISGADLTQSAPIAAPPARQELPERLGDFRILKEIGRGGMGIVYEAVQESLGRRVALKILPQSIVMGEQQRQRFEREARAAAQLHHTNIVPIFGVGEQAKTSYYIMQFIEGQPLDQVIDTLRRQAQEQSGSGSKATHNRNVNSQVTVDIGSPAVNELVDAGAVKPQDGSAGFATDFLSLSASNSAATSDSGKSSRSGYFRSVARIGRDVAGALQHAFDQKVIHRDIKPANLILDIHGTIWVTDFGLARFHESPAVTQPGDVIGTLRYMSPEALEGKGDVRADICSLGLTLYELLVLRPAHDAVERRQLLQQIAGQTPAPLRKINPRIPRDLETIISKAIAHEAVHRYQTPGEMAQDLERFLNDEPIAARRISTTERLVRWARKHPALASTTGAAALLAILLVAASVFWWRAAESLNTQQSRELTEQKHRLEQANDAAVLMRSFLEPMVDNARISQQAERRGQAIQQMRDIAVAVFNFDAAYHRLPADIVAADGKPLLSWRVEILPFLAGQNKLAEKFRRDERWDSAHNKALLAEIPDVFAPVVVDDRAEELAQGMEVARRASSAATRPDGGFQAGQSMEALQLDLTRRMVDFIRRESAVGKNVDHPESFRVDRSLPVTFYQAFAGPGTLFDGHPHSLSNVPDGNSTTILFVESADAVEWTKPGGLKVNASEKLPNFGGLGFPDHFGIVMVDGSVHLVKRNISRDLLRKMITPGGAEDVPVDWDSP